MAASNSSPSASDPFTFDGAQHPNLLVLDSIGYIAQPSFEIAGKVIVSGSHGGTAAAGYILDHPQKPKLVFFNDAGGGKDGAGIAGLAQLQAVGVAACTYSHQSARIGQAQDGLEHGLISFCNALAQAVGIQPGATVRNMMLAVLAEQPVHANGAGSGSGQAGSVVAISPSVEPDPLGPPLRSFRDPNYKALATNLAELRQQIDSLDENIIALMAQRALLVKDAARFKADHFQVSAPKRQMEVFAKARQRAMRHNPGFDGFEEVVEQSYRTMVAQFIAKESLYFDQLVPAHS
jgi:isochorismate pyruvate lyase